MIDSQFPYMDVLKVIADETRMAILQVLKDGALTVSDIEEKTGKSHSTTSQQLKRMLSAKLVTFKREGTQKFYQIRDNQIFDMLDSISSYLSTSEIIDTQNGLRGKKIMLMGLDSSGKTSILLSFLGNKNLVSYMNKNLKATHGKRHMIEILADLNLQSHIQPDSVYFEYGGQVVFREEFKKDPESILRGFEKIIYVIDVQDEKRYKESLDYLKDIVKSLEKISPSYEMDVFLHKFDPNIDADEKYSQLKINEDLVGPINKIIPVGFKTTVYKTTIYTVFRKSLIMQTYHAA